MKRQLFFYEAPEDGGGAPADPVEPVEPVADATAGDQAGAEEAAAWALSQDDWNATVNYLQQTAPIIQQVAQMLQSGAAPAAQPAQPMLPEIDPFDPESIQQYISAAVQQGIEQNMSAYQPVFSSLAETEGQRLAHETMERLKSSVGDFDPDATYMIAAGALADESLDPNQVLEGAARYMHEFEQRIRADERQRYQQSLEGLKNAPSDGPVGIAAATETETVPKGPRRYHEAVERVLARRNPTTPVG